VTHCTLVALLTLAPSMIYQFGPLVLALLLVAGGGRGNVRLPARAGLAG
jgi:hypothetical protein